MTHAIELLGLGPNGNNYNTFKDRCDYENVDYQFLKDRSRYNNINRLKHSTDLLKIPHDKLFSKNSPHRRSVVKQRIIKENLIEYKCSDCGNNGTHNDKELVLQIEHKNGISNDHRLSNLTFLCPNCHSQTETYAGKTNKSSKDSTKINKNNRQKNICPICNKNNKSTKSNMCSKCHHKNTRKVERPSYEELLTHINDKIPMTKIGKLYNVSDNAVRKWLKSYGHYDK